MTQVNNLISKIDEKNLMALDASDSAKNEDVINNLVGQGLPRAFNPSNYINRIAKDYGISVENARSCLKEAINILEDAAKEKVQQQDDEKLYAQSGYFYPQQYTNSPQDEQDGMDSLAKFGSYQRLKFGLY